MKKLKFRFWHKEDKEWENLGYYREFGQDNIDFEEDGSLKLNDSYEVFEWTGLKDSNEKDIFEGDILEISDYGGSYKSLVFWGKVESFILKNDAPSNNFLETWCVKRRMRSGDATIIPLGLYLFESLKIIGNTKENRKLFKTCEGN